MTGARKPVTIVLLTYLAAMVMTSALGMFATARAQPPPPPGPPPPGQPPPPPPGQPPPTQPAPLQTEDDSGSGTGWVPWVVGGVVALAGIALVAMRTRAPVPATVAPSGHPADAAQPNRGLDELLEVGRRLTSATTAGDIERAVVREARGLVTSKAAAIVRCTETGLTVAHETQELLRADRLDQGIFRRVAETGQPIAQVSATEPALRNLPAALLAVPLVGGGRVDAILTLVRGESSPFTPIERERMMSLAPIAAAAMQSARHSDEKTYTDPLTGVGNRRRLDTDLPKVMEDATGPTGVIMVDLDHFKSVNDTHGHPAGDALLRAVARILRDTVRPGDAVYRYGGEEFCVVLPETDEETASTVAERIRTAISAQAFDVGAAEPLPVTASLGVASTTEPDQAALIARADAALYEAKRGGRNRVVSSGAGGS